MEDEVEPEGSGCAGAVVITAAVSAALAGVYALSPEGLVLGLWVLGWSALIWATGWRPKKLRRTANPAPPPLPERGCEEEPQVTMVRDTAHPNRWVVAHPSRWLAENPGRETGTT